MSIFGEILYEIAENLRFESMDLLRVFRWIRSIGERNLYPLVHRTNFSSSFSWLLFTRVHSKIQKGIKKSNLLIRQNLEIYPILSRFKFESLKLESFTEVGKSQAKLERTQRSWKEPSKVGKIRPKLESFFWSWKVSLKLESFAAVGNFWLKLESLNEIALHYDVQ